MGFWKHLIGKEERGREGDTEREGGRKRRKEREVRNGWAEFLPTLLLPTLLNNHYDKKRIYPLLLVLKPRPGEAK